jgi:hypothetical protein
MNYDRDEFIRRQAALVCGGGTSLPEALAARVFRELTRAEEIESGRTDRWGNWEWRFGHAQREGNLYRPWLDEAMQAAAGGGTDKSRWPGGKKWALCLTHDVDVVSQRETGLSPWRAVRTELGGPRDWNRLATRTLRAAARTLRSPWRRGGDPVWCFERWLETEAAHGFKSSWLFFPSRITRRHRDDCYYKFGDVLEFEGRRMTVRDLMRHLATNGYDVGLHGSCRTFDDSAMLLQQRQEIEEACGQPVVSTRQHYLRYSAAISPRVHAAAGVAVDSTQGFNFSVGFRAGTCFPYWCWDHSANRSLSVLEVPLVIMDTCLFGPAGLEYDEAMAVAHTVEIMDRVRAAGGVLTLNWHPNNITIPGFFSSYCAVLAEAARRDPWCGTLRDIHAHRLEFENSL